MARRSTLRSGEQRKRDGTGLFVTHNSIAPAPMPPRSRAAAGAASFPPVPANCVVTGGSGFVGQRLVEMLVERGAKRVVSFDVAPTPRDALQDARVVYQQGNLTKLEDVLKACEVRAVMEP